MKISNIKNIGRFETPDGKKINIKKGRKVGYGVDLLFYLYRGTRIYISDAEFGKYTEIH
jgi:hypothetical protein